MASAFPLVHTATPVPDDQRAAILAAPGFGLHFTDHMAFALWTPEAGWHDRRVQALQPFSLHPSAAVLHYANAPTMLARSCSAARGVRCQPSAVSRLSRPAEFVRCIEEGMDAQRNLAPGAPADPALVRACRGGVGRAPRDPGVSQESDSRARSNTSGCLSMGPQRPTETRARNAPRRHDVRRTATSRFSAHRLGASVPRITETGTPAPPAYLNSPNPPAT
jgi:hypothetical protein